jgi:hypothetical protein
MDDRDNSPLEEHVFGVILLVPLFTVSFLIITNALLLEFRTPSVEIELGNSLGFLRQCVHLAKALDGIDVGLSRVEFDTSVGGKLHVNTNSKLNYLGGQANTGNRGHLIRC